MTRRPKRAAAAARISSFALVAALLAPDRVRADLVLQVVDPHTSGVFALRAYGGGAPLRFQAFPASMTPTIARTDGGTATLDQAAGSSLNFTFGVDASGTGAVMLGTTGTYSSPTSASSLGPSPVALRIAGTAGETGPVTLLVSSVFTYSVEGPSDYGSFSATHSLDGATLPVPAGPSGDSPFTFNVGDVLQYQVWVDSVLAPPLARETPHVIGSFSTTLRVVPAVPEPSSLVLGLTGGLGSLGAAWHRRRSRAVG